MKRAASMSIDNTRQAISCQDVAERIAELEENRDYTVYRIRTGDVLQVAFETREAANEYIDREDFNPERIGVRQAELNDYGRNELRSLEQLAENANRTFGAAWRENSITLYRYSYFTADWAREQAAVRIPGLSLADLDKWPLSSLNWEQAAFGLRNEDYLRVFFGDVDYYGKTGDYGK
jgi:hypothetical protein